MKYCLLSLRQSKYRGLKSKIPVLLVGGIMLTVIQQYPIVRDRLYGEIRLVLYLVFALLSVLGAKRITAMKIPIFIKLYIGVVVVSAIELIFFQLLRWRATIDDITEILIPLGILIGSYTISFDDVELDLVLDVYSIIATAMGLLIVLYYGGGFVIRETYLTGISKNQTGPILGIACIIAFSRMVSLWDIGSIKKRKGIIISAIVFIVSLSSMFVLRNRSGLLGLLFVIPLIALWGKKKMKLGRLILILIAILLLIVLQLAYGIINPLLDILYRSFVLNYDINDVNSLSAGRVDVYGRALDFTASYPIFGELNTVDRFFGRAHNYILNKWVRYGIIGSLPMIILYISLFAFDARLLLSRIRTSKSVLAGWLLLFGLIISTFEYTYPYGPGVSQIVVWFMIGQVIRKQRPTGKDEHHHEEAYS